MSGAIVLRAGGIRIRTSGRVLLVGGALLLVVCALVLTALMLGARSLSAAQVLAAFLPGAEGIDRMVVLQWRAPRAVAAAAFGACLGASGAIFQSITRNPLGSPDVIGLNTGAYTGVVFVLAVGGSGYLAQVGGALAGGLLATALVYLLSYRGGVHGFRLVIVGISISAMLSSVNTWFSVKADLGVALQAAVWGAGTLNGTAWGPLAFACGAALIAFLFVPAAGRSLRVLDLGDDAAGALGLPVERSKILLVLLGTVLTALVTAAAGPIPFVALAAPQIARRLSGNADSALLGVSALTGAALLSGADIIAQHAIPGLTVPTGSVTVCLGGGYLVWLLVRETRRG